jgi:putative flippase GtrA
MQEPELVTPRRARLLPQLLKFGVVGGFGVVINFVVFNGLMLLVFTPRGIHHGAIFATILGTLVAIVANWVGNRYWAFAAQRHSSTVREGVEFFLVSLAGLAIPLLCVWISHYVLGFSSLLADNIANYIVGLALGTAFRFVLYRFWVFAPGRPVVAVEPVSATTPTATITSTTPSAASNLLPGAPDGGLISGS